MSIHVCKCEHNGRTEYHLRYPGMTKDEAQALADHINGGTHDADTEKDHMNTQEQSVGVEIPQYQCHKKVRAVKITGFRANGNTDCPDILLGELGGIVSCLPEWQAKHQPKIGDYYVMYDGGYTSVSPAKAFEDGYTRL